jgi:hypothetical protein
MCTASCPYVLSYYLSVDIHQKLGSAQLFVQYQLLKKAGNNILKMS